MSAVVTDFGCQSDSKFKRYQFTHLIGGAETATLSIMRKTPLSSIKTGFAFGGLLFVMMAGGIFFFMRQSGKVPTGFSGIDGKSAKPVEAVDLARRGVSKILRPGGSWKELPFHLSREEERDTKRCVAIANRIHSTADGVNEFSKVQTRHELEQVLENRPGSFYAQFLLGVWHSLNGDDESAERYHRQSLENAPSVIVLHYVRPDGTGISGLPIATTRLECNRVQNGGLDPSLKLLYLNLTTDSSGYVYLPAYDTVYRIDLMAHPPGYRADYPSLGWFRSKSRVGILPQVVARPVMAKSPTSSPPENAR